MAKLAQIQVRAWEYIYDGHIDEAVQAMIAQRPDGKLNEKSLAGQITLYEDFFSTEATAGMAYGLQTDADWELAIASMEDAGVIESGHKPAEYYTNELLG